jgi:hypothetical protein
MKSVDWNIDESWLENVSMRPSAKRTANLGWSSAAVVDVE